MIGRLEKETSPYPVKPGLYQSCSDGNGVVPGQNWAGRSTGQQRVLRKMRVYRGTQHIIKLSSQISTEMKNCPINDVGTTS